MTIPFEIFGATVEQIRAWRRQGERASTIVNRLLPANDRVNALAHLQTAFCTNSLPNFQFYHRDAGGVLRPEPIDEVYEPLVEKARPVWENAPPYPDLYRRRDRHAFRAVAEKYGARVLVAATDHRVARLIGREGYRPCPAGLWGRPRTLAPNAGLLAADRDDEELLATLARRSPALSFDDYLAELELAGLRVSGEDAGYVIRDEANHAFYPGYYLQGVYSAEGRNLWSGRQGEIIWSELNRRLGEHLIPYGPHDLWELRGQSASFAAPLFPVLIFEPDGNVDVRQTRDQLRAYYRYHYLPWEGLYGD